MLPLFPDIHINQEYQLQVGHVHKLYIEEAGNRDGIPVLFLQDGPCVLPVGFHRRFFDAEFYRIIQFDLRGTGRSSPFAETLENTRRNLIDDIAAVLDHLNVERCLILGLGFGGQLALDFSSAQPSRVLGLMLVNIADYSAASFKWLFEEGANQVFPDLWASLLHQLPLTGSGESTKEWMQNVALRLDGANDLIQQQSARAWVEWVMGIASFHPDQALLHEAIHSHMALALAKIQVHYFLNDSGHSTPLAKVRGKAGASRLSCLLIHGRYNMRSPVANALAVQSSLAGAELQLIRDAGHSLRAPALIDAIIRATQGFQGRVEPELA